MRSALDSSVVVSALNEADPQHSESLKILNSPGNSVFAHVFSETFSTLTGGKLGFRVPASQAASLLKSQLATRFQIVSLTPADLMKAYAEAESRGVRGGAIYDFLHLIAAKKAKADRFHTLNIRDFSSFHRSGDPEICSPQSD